MSAVPEVCPICRNGEALHDPDVGETIRWCACGWLDTVSVGGFVMPGRCSCEDAPCCGCGNEETMTVIWSEG